MKKRFMATLQLSVFTASLCFPLYADEKSSPVLKYDDYMKAVEKSLPEIRSNEIDVMLAENDLKSAKSAGDTSLTAGGDYSSTQQYNMMSGTGVANAGRFYAGISKKLIPTGTSISTELDYTRTKYSEYSTVSDYSTYEPSISLKVSQPLLYNFLGKVDKYAEKNAKMQYEIEKVKYTENNKSVLNAYRKLYFEWILYREILKNLEESITNSKKLQEQVARQVKARVADQDDYQEVVAATLEYEGQYREYLTSMKKIENQVRLYLSMEVSPDTEAFSGMLEKSMGNGFGDVEFSKTSSARLIDLAMENLNYTKDVKENELLPELNIYGEVSRKSISDSSQSSMELNKTDYSVGFEFTYSLENNSAESALKEAEIGLLQLKYEYQSTLKEYRKSLAEYRLSAEGNRSLIKNAASVLGALNTKLRTERKKYNQARLKLSYIIETENSIASKKIELLQLQYQLIGNYIDYTDLTR